MSETLINFLIGFLSALLGGLGMGGGGILLIYLTVFAGYSQLNAQGINLLFFLPIAVVALIFHCKNHFVNIKVALFSVVGGVGGVFLGKYLADLLGDNSLKKIFAAFLFLIGLKELFTRGKKEEKK